MSEQPPPQDLVLGEPIAIVGIGCMFPQAPDLNTYWRNIKSSHDAITAIPASHWNPDDYFDPDPSAPDMTYARRGGFLDPVAFNPLHYGISPNTIEATDSTQLLTLVAAEQALVNAGYAVRENSSSGRAFDRSRTCVMLGVTGTLELVIPLGARLGHPRWRKAMLDAGIPSATTEEIIERIAAGYVPWQEQSFPGLLGNVAAGRIANRLNLGGANCVVDAACASSISAIHMAAMELSLGRCDMAISGGVDTFNNIFMYMCFSKTPALSASGDSRPFSAAADGTMLGEGVGIVVLKRLSDARRDGDQIQAIIKGIGASSDGAGNAIYAPSSNGQSRALRAAYQQAGVRPRTIELVEAHGTGTRVGDQVEANSLSTVFSEDAVDDEQSSADVNGQYHSWCALGSVKSMIGHTKAAAGVAGLIKTVLALQHKVLPPTLKVDQPLESLTPGRSPVYVNTRARPWIAQRAHPRRAAVSAFGFGGSNFHCVLEEAQSAKKAADWSGDLQLIAFGAEHREGVLEQLASFQQAIAKPASRADAGQGDFGQGDAKQSEHAGAQAKAQQWGEVRRQAKHSRDRFSSSAQCRFVFVLRATQLDDASLFDRLQNLAQPQARPDPGLRGFYAQGERQGQLGIIFPGQGSQRVNMLLDVSCQFPAMLDRWSQVDASASNAQDKFRISERVYPLPVFDAVHTREQGEALRATRIAQPALAAASLGMLDILADFGVHANAFAGHSFGEFIALYAAGAISDDTLLQLARQRGECMEIACTQNRGSMLAVSAEIGAIKSVLEAHSLDLAIANHNSPSQVVLSGAIDALHTAREVFSTQGMHAVPLNVAGAFHSPLMDSARERFAAHLDAADVCAPSQPVYSNVSASPYPLDAAQIRTVLGAQITAPVRFVEMIRAMYDDGIRTFVEAGPGKVLQSLVGAILNDRPHQVIALDASTGQAVELEDLAIALAQLAASGHHIDLRQWDPAPPQARTIDGFTIQICGANHFQPKQMPAMQHRLSNADREIDSTSQITTSAIATAAVHPAAPQARAQRATTQATTSATAPASPLSSSLSSSLSPSRSAMFVREPSTTGTDMDLIQSTLLALQKMQQQTSDLHRQYLESQQTAQRSIELLIRQQLQASGTALPSQDVEATMPAAALAATAPVHVAATPNEVLPAHTAQQAVPSAAQQHDAAQTISAQNVTTDTVAGATTAVMESLLEIVAEKTGYPREVLTAEMSLDADLGIDSIKRVEIFSALADYFPQFARVSADEAGSLDTLQQIEAHLSANATPVLADPVLAPAQALDTTTTAAGADVLRTIIKVIADKTGYPSEALNASMRLDEDLGIDSIKRVEILSVLQDLFPDLPNIEADTVGSLQTIAEIGHLLSAAPRLTEPAFALDGIAPRQALTRTTLEAKPGAEPSTEPSAIAVHRSDSNEDTGLQIRQVIADKTGYPAEMLDINMQLDADLGIDSIKRVEIFSILQERFPHAPMVEPDTMASLQRIGDIVDYLEGGSTAPRPTTRPATSNGGNGTALSCPLDAPRAAQYTAQMTLPSGPGNLGQGLHRLLVKCVPVAANSRASLQLPANAVIGIVADDTPLASALRLAFEQRGIFSKLISATHPQLEETVTGLLIVSPAHVTTNTLSQLFRQLRAYGPQLQRAAAVGPTILAAVSRLNGQFGLGTGADTQAIDQALSGGLGGMIKSAAREWLDVHCKSIDIAPRWDNQQQIAQAIVSEALLGGPLEVGLSQSGPVTLELSAANLPAPSGSQALVKRAELVLVSGGARGITAAIAIALAHRFQPTLLLIGRSPAPQPEADWLHGLDEETAIKQAIHRYHAEAKSPKEIEGVYQHTIANRQMLQTIAAIDASGAKAIYRSVDIRSAEQLANTLETVTNEYGPLRGIVHGAGVLADGLIGDKTDQQFAAVLSTKCEGFINLLAAVDDSAPAFIVACSSTTARLGRRGQADYAAANECLNKLAQQAARQHPNSKVLSVNWGPWDGGMVDARLKTIFSKEGVGLIPLDAGAQYLLDELCSVACAQTEQAVEVVILGPTPSQTLACPIVDQPLVIAPLASLQSCYSQDVSVIAMPILGSHVINARAVVPVALIIEWLAHGALHASPGLRFVGLENFRLLKGITIDALQSLNIQVLAGATERQPSDQGVREVITMELRSGEQLHARAQIHLGDSYANAATASPPVARTPYTRRPYADDSALFHGAQLQGITRISACDEGGISGESNAAPPPAQWIKAPFRTQWLADPLVLDASFQMMILWAEQIYHHGCLPTSIGRLELYAPFPASCVAIDVQLQAHQAHKANASIEFSDADGAVIARIEDYECVIDGSLNASFARNTFTDNS